MKKLFLLTILFISGAAFAQQQVSLEAFKALKSEVDANIQIVKSDVYKIEYSGNTELAEKIKVEVGGQEWSKKVTNSGVVINSDNLTISSKEAGISFKDLVVKVYVPELKVVSLSEGGRITMDNEFSKTDNFVLSISNGAVADFSNIDFNSLVVSSDSDSELLYKSVKNMVSSNKNGSRIVINRDR
ncbi:GIN domain-containing protein [Salegentibacter chungangensis]|uniref:GIN domain-containing protein n=1 Tax=Salegentibacter chungangensis TaxID=1335724 RepID=A0ABW3NTW5_9FLAO